MALISFTLGTKQPIEVHDAVPKWTHERKTFTSLYYVARTFFWGAAFYVSIKLTGQLV